MVFRLPYIHVINEFISYMLTTGRNRDQERASQNQMLNRLIVRYNRVIGREIARAMNDYARNRNNPMVEIRHIDNMTRILTRLWTQSGVMSINHNFDIVKAYYNFELKRDITTPIMDNAIALWIRAFGGQKITQITDTTKNDINQIVADAREEGLSERETAKLINAVAPSKSASRAQTIARTEVHASSQGMSLAVAGETEIPMVKVWLSDRSDTARPEHVEVDGQKRSLNEPFDVGGEQLMYPGDANGSAENTINCKCVIGYEIA